MVGIEENDFERREMKKRLSDNLWIPFWVDKWIFGSLRIEFSIEERAIWIDLLALAAKDNGYIRANEETPYPLSQLAGMLIIPEELLEKSIEKFIALKKIRKLNNRTLYISTWQKYQLSNSYKRWLKHKNILPKQTGDVCTQTKLLAKSNHIKSNHIKSNHNNKYEKYELLFEELWKQWPSEGRFKKKYCRMKFLALCKQGKLEEFQKTSRGYSDYLKHKKENENFEQRPMYLSTWLNNWEEEKGHYIEFRYEPKL